MWWDLPIVGYKLEAIREMFVQTKNPASGSFFLAWAFRITTQGERSQHASMLWRHLRSV